MYVCVYVSVSVSVSVSVCLSVSLSLLSLSVSLSVSPSLKLKDLIQGEVKPRWLSGKWSASGAGDPGMEHRFLRSSPTTDIGICTLAAVLPGSCQCLDWSVRCQYTVAGWNSKLGVKRVFQCGGRGTVLRRSVTEILLLVAGTTFVRSF